MGKNAMKYYDLRRNWKKVERHISNPRVADVLVRDFNRFTYGRCRQRFTAGQYPFDFESCDWWISHRGRQPRFWKYVKHAACHWTANWALGLAQLVRPDRPWRIITSNKHSTVWDGKDTLFDFNFLALGVTPEECFSLAHKRELAPGQHIKTYFAEHYSSEMKRLAS
jgi:hypothetical protein